MIKAKRIGKSVLGVSVALMFSACGFEYENEISMDTIQHALITNDELKLLLVNERFLVKSRIGNSHSSQHIFLEESFYISSALSLKSVVTGSVRNIQFTHVATSSKPSLSPFLTSKAGETAIRIGRSQSFATCADIEAEVPCLKAKKHYSKPNRTLGTYDFNGEYRFTVTSHVLVFRPKKKGVVEAKPIARIPFSLNNTQIFGVSIFENKED